MSKAKKSTKKFVAKGHLKAQIRNRHKNKKFAAKKQQHAGEVKAAAQQEAEARAAKRVEDMNIDDFLDGGFEDVVDDSDAEDDEEIDASGDSDIDGELDDSELGDEASDEGDAAGGTPDDSDDDSDGGDDSDPLVVDNKRLKGEVSRHKAQLEALKAKDPEFYAYLQQTDAELLGFGADDEDESDLEVDEDEDEEESDEDEQPAKKADKKKKKDQEADEAGAEDEELSEDEEGGRPTRVLLVTTALVNKWTEAVRLNAALGSFKNLIQAYRLACHYGDPEKEEEDESRQGRMRISSSSVYNSLMLFMLKEADATFRRLLGLDKRTAPLAVEDVTRNSRWKKVEPLVKSYWGNSIHLLSTMTDAPLIAFTLRRLRASTVFLGAFRKIQDKFLKQCLGIFGTGDVNPRLQAFLCIRELAVRLPAATTEKCLKGMYKTYIANSKFVTAASAPHIAFMATCCVELWGLDLQASYQHAFSAIRQLAFALRNALSMKTQDAYKEVYSWQAINCLELWVKVLGAHADKAELRPLVYPLVQLLLGAARLVPTPRYFPLRLRLVRAINRLAAATGFFIPVASTVLDMLQWSELHRKPQAASGPLPDLGLQLRVGKTVLKSTAFQEEVVQQVLELLAEHLGQWSCSIAFPELVHVPLMRLRKFAKDSPVERFRRFAKQLVDAIERNIKFVGNARDKVNFSPKDVAKVGAFLRDEAAAGSAPLAVYVKQLMDKAAQRQAMRAASEVTVKENGKRKRQEDSDDDASEEDDPSDLSDDDGAAPAPQAKKAKAAKPVRKVAADEDGEILDMDEGEDRLEDYVLSSEDEDLDGGYHADHAYASEDDDDDDGDSESGDGDDNSDGDHGSNKHSKQHHKKHGAHGGHNKPHGDGHNKHGGFNKAHKGPHHAWENGQAKKTGGYKGQGGSKGKGHAAKKGFKHPGKGKLK